MGLGGVGEEAAVGAEGRAEEGEMEERAARSLLTAHIAPLAEPTAPAVPAAAARPPSSTRPETPARLAAAARPPTTAAVPRAARPAGWAASQRAGEGLRCVRVALVAVGLREAVETARQEGRGSKGGAIRGAVPA